MSARRLVFGIGPVRELLRAGRGQVEQLWVSRARAERAERAGDRRGSRDGRPPGRGGKPPHGGNPRAAERDPSSPLDEIIETARRLGIPVELRDAAALDQAAGPGAVHQGVIAVAAPFAYVDLDDMVAAAFARAAAGAPPPLLVALDSVTDPHNLGAIARSAYLLGASGLIVPRDRAAEVTPAAAKASAGATEHLPIAQVTNLSRALSDLKTHGIWIAAIAAGERAIPLATLDGTMALCLVLGAEGTGIRPLVARQADLHVAIPMTGDAVGSFNVSVAAAIALYEVARQRRR